MFEFMIFFEFFIMGKCFVVVKGFIGIFFLCIDLLFFCMLFMFDYLNGVYDVFILFLINNIVINNNGCYFF